MLLTDNILSENKFQVDDYNPVAIAKTISKQFKDRRLEQNVTQEALAQKSGVSLGSIKRFETKAEISLKNLLMLAVVLNTTSEFFELFSKKQYNSIAEIVAEKKQKSRQRAHTSA